MSSITYCGSCSHACCGCKCQRGIHNEHCHYCKGCVPNPLRNYSHSWFDSSYYSEHYICFPCKKAWKTNTCRWEQWLYLKKKTSSKFSSTDVGPILCSQCNKVPTNVAHTVRVPKRGDVKGWKLLGKILATKFNTPKTLGWEWNKKGGLGCTLHMTDAKRALFWVPRKLSEYPRWVTYMDTIKYDD